MHRQDAESIEGQFAATAPQEGRRLVWYAAAGFLAAGLFMIFFQKEGPAFRWKWFVILPWVAVFLALGGNWLGARRQRERRGYITRAWQHVQLEEWSEADRVLDRAMRAPIRLPADRCRAFMLLAQLAERTRAFDSAAKIYETLLLNRIGDGYQLQQTQLALTAVKLKNEELTDGIDLLDRLEKVPMPQALIAVRALVRLYQQVFMGHYEDAVRDSSQRRSLFRRYLSTKAGYGYGLLAAAMHHLRRPEEASRLWRDATTLIPAEKLVAEHDFLALISQRYSAMEYRL